MKRPRYLTKSRFKLGLGCETKLFYTGKKEYANKTMEDSFLAALAEGGFQVGELAKCYYPGGHDITTLDYEEAEKQTLELLKRDEVIIFEPAIRFENLFIRIDILVKKGNNFKLIEVKAKSFDADIDDPFHNKKTGGILAAWSPYLYDVAFQKYVLQKAYPEANIVSSLLLADKNVKCSVDGLNQKFRIVRSKTNRTGVEVSHSLSEEDLKEKILINVNVDDCVREIIYSEEGESFSSLVKRLAVSYENDQRLDSPIGKKCSSCEFKCSDDQDKLKSGYKECWSKALGWVESDFKELSVLDVWNFRKKDELIDEGVIKMSQLTEDDFKLKEDDLLGITSSQRQWLQVEMEQKGETEPYFDVDGMSQEMQTWIYPLHFIDFETTAMAIPFNKGRKPYEGLAFQFSHHTVYKDGHVEHTGQYLNTNIGEFPSYDFLRELKAQLEGDEGSIFCYSQHENSFLNLIYRQLKEDESDISDREELCEFIKTITHSSSSTNVKWKGSRDMVDMWKLVKRYYFDPRTKGSNSIKAVLPAILNSSNHLQNKYSQPIYGSLNGVSSLNFKNWQWVQIRGSEVIDPYKLLPKMFEDVTDHDMNLMSAGDELRDGGAALTAYARMQFTEMSDYEKNELTQALLKYCELDTFAMVLIFEGWVDLIESYQERDQAVG